MSARLDASGRGCLAFGVAVALALGACTQESQHAPPPAVAATPVPASPSPITARGHGIRGKAVLGKDGYGIVLCGETDQHIMEVSPAAKPFLDKFLAGGAHEFFVEAESEDAPPGRVRVARFHRLYSQGPGCDAKLDPTAFVAWGNEPFWAASDEGGTLRLERPGSDPLVAANNDAREAAGEWIVEGQTPTGLLSVHFKPGFCSDGMSDALYGWSATATFGDQTLHGCGFPGFERR